MSKYPVSVTVNGFAYLMEVEPSKTLLELIRDDLGLTGTKCGCENGECGVCTVLVDGVPIRSCLMLAVEADGAEITTVEGLAPELTLAPLQQAFLDAGAVQCGFCTPGMLLAAKALLDRNSKPSLTEIKTALGGHLCRCGGYASIQRAVENAAEITK